MVGFSVLLFQSLISITLSSRSFWKKLMRFMATTVPDRLGFLVPSMTFFISGGRLRKRRTTTTTITIFLALCPSTLADYTGVDHYVPFFETMASREI
ncbi:hypothetical protein FNV43_RR17578 [Rhamnella rubrinervis]|uniref:Uncharacterized protein n=1 Tax=Rhamnella rubrinervis TaxID=2594499 RepID=A0A8K0GS20_9ROSA|nr:hypothetical protein FNV43_RR17578 [Rhamnella rubrinervis]